MSKNARKRKVERLREEGRKAFLDGKHVQQVPREYLGTMDRYQWEQGYVMAKPEAIDREAVRGESPSNPPTDDTIEPLVDRLIEDVEVVAIIDDGIRSEMRAEWIEKVRSALRGER